MDLMLAAAGAFGYGFASVLQGISARRSRGALATLTSPMYLAGLALDLLAWLASLAALRGLPVYEVQAVLAGSLAVTVLTAWLVLDYRLRAGDLIAIAITVAALAAIALASGPQHPVSLSSAGRWALTAAAIAVAIAGCWAARGRRAEAAGALAGLAFGGAAVSARAFVLPAHPQNDVFHTVVTAGTGPAAWSLAVFGVTGMMLYASALEHGDVGRVTALLWIMEVVAPSAAGVLLLHDSVRPGWLPVMVIALAAAVVSATALALAPSQDLAGGVPRERAPASVRT